MTQVPLRHEKFLAALTAAHEAAKAHPEASFNTCIVDSGGQVIGLLRHDGAAIASALSAEAKARTALYLLTDTGGLPPRTARW